MIGSGSRALKSGAASAIVNSVHALRWVGLQSSLLILVMIPAAPARAQTPPSSEPVVVAQGEALLTLPADRAYVQIGAEGRGSKPSDAQRIAANAMNGILSALKTLGFGADALQTTSYSLQPEYDFVSGERRLRDYVARNVVEVRVDDLARLPDVLDDAGASGAASVSGLRFDLKDRSAAEREALRLAVQDGMTRAQAMATGAGKALGAIVRVQEQRTSPPSPVFQTALASAGGRAAPSTPIESGEIQVRAEVTLSVALR